ncbi:MAG: hypothetical protein ACFHVJ_14270 [Aestuariibacter sp.]
MKSLRSFVVIILVIFASLATNAIACERHDGAEFGRFGSFNPLAFQHFNPATNQPLSIMHPNTAYVESGGQSYINISYRIPKNYRNVKVSFSGSEGIEFVDSSTLSLNNKFGVYKLKYKANKSGTLQIDIQIDAISNDKPYTKEQRISVVSA